MIEYKGFQIELNIKSGVIEGRATKETEYSILSTPIFSLNFSDKPEPALYAVENAIKNNIELILKNQEHG
jgi:hypothetical protein